MLSSPSLFVFSSTTINSGQDAESGKVFLLVSGALFRLGSRQRRASIATCTPSSRKVDRSKPSSFIGDKCADDEGWEMEVEMAMEDVQVVPRV